MAGAIERGIDEKEAAELDLCFHDALYSASRHQRLLDFWAMLRPQVYVLMLSRNVASPHFSDAAVRGHQQILDAVKAGDKQQALDVTEAHMTFGYDLVNRNYEPARTGADQEREAARQSD